MKREVQLVERIARGLQSKRAVKDIRNPPSSVQIGIGDDAAVLKASPHSQWVVSCDAFVQDIHFRMHTHPADSVGYKSLMRATSDMAAMGATPRYYLLTLALPAFCVGRWLDEFLAGMSRAARKLRIHIVGGDTTRGSKIFLSLTVIGEARPGQTVSRDGARPGDLVYLSGTLGRAQLGLALTLAGHARTRSVHNSITPHLYPRARTELGIWLAHHKIPSSMIDISDGLSTDLARVCAASGVGANLDAEKIRPVVVPRAARKFLANRRFDPLQAALHGGDDYELLFTVPPRKEKLLRRARGISQLCRIGEITRAKQIIVTERDGHSSPLEPNGWDSFR